MMKYIFTLFALFSSLAFGQYIKKATITSKKTNNSFLVHNVQYKNDGKIIKFNLDSFKNSLIHARIKDFDLKFDSADYSKNIPKLKEVYYQNSLNYSDGLYLTKEDFINKAPQELNFEMKSNMASDSFEYPSDLVNFYDVKGKYPEFQQNKYFAIVQNGDVYFSLKQFSKLMKKNKNTLGGSIPGFAYVRVKAGNENNLYFELPKTKQNNSYLYMFGIAGAIADAIVTDKSLKTNDPSSEQINLVLNGFFVYDINIMKGIVFDTKINDFVIFDKCEELNDYTKKHNPSLNIDCQKDYTLDKQREIINNLK